MKPPQNPLSLLCSDEDTLGAKRLPIPNSSLALLIGLLSTLWPHHLAALPQDQPAGKAKPVRTLPLQEQTTLEWSEYHGIVRSRNSVELIALVAGRVKAVHVKAGQAVHERDLLVELDSAEFHARVQAAESRKAAAEAAKIDADHYFTRIQNLFPKGSATKEDLDTATARQQSAEAAFREATARVEEARTALQYTELRSPINGIIVDKKVNPGDFTMPGLPASAGMPSGRVLLTLYDPDALWFEVSIPERLSSSAKVGAPVTVIIEPAQFTLEGKFVEVMAGVDESSRNFIARVDLPPSSTVKVGMTGRARFVTGEKRVLTVPAEALVNRGQLDMVFLAEGGRARLHLVRSGKRTSDKIEILSGLRTGEMLIVNPTESLRDGDSVETTSIQP
jgi:RND family efflux transporter MFP subunit